MKLFVTRSSNSYIRICVFFYIISIEDGIGLNDIKSFRRDLKYPVESKRYFRVVSRPLQQVQRVCRRHRESNRRSITDVFSLRVHCPSNLPETKTAKTNKREYQTKMYSYRNHFNDSIFLPKLLSRIFTDVMTRFYNGNREQNAYITLHIFPVYLTPLFISSLLKNKD